nr:MAG TPA: hypothetical protein [Caudoviricetes sp.]
MGEQKRMAYISSDGKRRQDSRQDRKVIPQGIS